MGVVYRAEDIWLGRLVALTFVDAAWAADPNAERQFLPLGARKR